MKTLYWVTLFLTGTFYYSQIKSSTIVNENLQLQTSTYVRQSFDSPYKVIIYEETKTSRRIT